MFAVKFNVTFAPGCNAAAEDANLVDHCTGCGAVSCASRGHANPIIALAATRLIAARQRKNSRMSCTSHHMLDARRRARASLKPVNLRQTARYGVAVFGRWLYRL